ncbi:porin, partial [Staphylococcus aureus]|nr:porin [Staphylococcus aureus]
DQLSYSGPLGGDGWSATVGVNWYLLDWVRLSLDGIHWRTDNRAGAFVGGDTGNTLYSRVQVSF